MHGRETWPGRLRLDENAETPRRRGQRALAALGGGGQRERLAGDEDAASRIGLSKLPNVVESERLLTAIVNRKSCGKCRMKGRYARHIRVQSTHTALSETRT